YVIVRAHFERAYDVSLLVPSREHQDGSVPRLANATQNLETTYIWQADVQHHDVGLGLPEHSKSFVPVTRRQHPAIGPAERQRQGEGLQDVRVVVNDQNSHALFSSTMCGPPGAGPAGCP